MPPDAPYLRSRQHHVDQYFEVRDHYIENPNAREEQEAAAQGAISGEMEPHVVVHGGETLDLGGVQVKVHHIPGHTAGSVAYEVLGQGSVFVGDSVQVHGAANGFPGYEDPDAYRASWSICTPRCSLTNLYLGHPYRTAAGSLGVELDPTETQQALEESLTIEARVRSAAKAAIEAGLQDTDTLYSPFDEVAAATGYTGDPRKEPRRSYYAARLPAALRCWHSRRPQHRNCAALAVELRSFCLYRQTVVARRSGLGKLSRPRRRSIRHAKRAAGYLSPACGAPDRQPGPR